MPVKGYDWTPKGKRGDAPEKPKIDFDANAFIARATKVGAQRATMEVVTDLLQMTVKAMQGPRGAK